MALALALSGCATRGPIRLACPIFDQVVTALPPSPLERDIRSGAPVPAAPEKALVSMAAAPPRLAPEADPLGEAFRIARPLQEKSLVEGREKALAAPAPAPVRALLLSGGGQWGAFGAGFLHQLHGSAAAIDPQIITGVSTGGLQSLFIGAGRDADYAALIAAYAPKSQAEIVTSNPELLAVVTGSMAGITPLRRRIEAALCTGGDPARGCPMIDALAGAPRQVLIGFVEADSGRFLVADINRMARHAGSAAPGTPARTRAYQTARDCITGAALASAGMPLYFQPVKIGDKVYYDGGVRQSVFLASVAEAAQRSAAAENAPLPTLYVVRNGPTALLSNGRPQDDPKVNSSFDALTAASRTQAIIVNQVELGSIAALRLYYPEGPIWLATADGYTGWTDAAGQPQVCTKTGKPRFFEPDFMACLRAYGATRAQRQPSPWNRLRPLSEAGLPAAGAP